MSTEYRHASPGIQMEAGLVPWDSEVLGYPVASISRLVVKDARKFEPVMAAFTGWLDANRIKLVSCRMPLDALDASFALEQAGFRFIETVLHPVCQDLQRLQIEPQGLRVTGVEPVELEAVVRLAEQCFSHERFHVDPRLDSQAANRRYGNWVRNTAGHSGQRLLKITEGDALVAFFVVEAFETDSAYWHLTAVVPEFQGKGYGKRVWRAVMGWHRDRGAESLSTTISVRNVPVLNLYSSLNFRFLPPEMTFHLLR